MKKTTLALVTGLILSAGVQAQTISFSDGEVTFAGDMRIDSQIRKTGENDTKYDSEGRLSLETTYALTQNGYKLEAKVNPLLKTDGKLDIDDVYLDIRGDGEDYMGVKLGRFEAMDLAPTQVDIFAEDAELQSVPKEMNIFAGHYNANTFRGRSENYGQVMFHGKRGIVNYELNVMAGDYNGNDNSAIAIRPAVSFKFNDHVSWSTGIEKSFDSESIDSDVFGVGTTVNLKANGFEANINYAYRDLDSDVKIGKETLKLLGIASAKPVSLDTKGDSNTLGANVSYKGFGIGAAFTKVDGEVKHEKTKSDLDFSLTTVYAGYEHKNFLVNDLTIAGGAYFSTSDFKASDRKENDTKDKGARLRLQYNF